MYVCKQGKGRATIALSEYARICTSKQGVYSAFWDSFQRRGASGGTILLLLLLVIAIIVSIVALHQTLFRAMS